MERTEAQHLRGWLSVALWGFTSTSEAQVLSPQGPTVSSPAASESPPGKGDKSQCWSHPYIILLAWGGGQGVESRLPWFSKAPGDSVCSTVERMSHHHSASLSSPQTPIPFPRLSTEVLPREAPSLPSQQQPQEASTKPPRLGVPRDEVVT